MRMAAMLMAVISLLGVPQGQAEVTWETAAVQILEESPETAAQTLLDWAETGQTAPEADVRSFLEERAETAASAAAAFAAVLDAADRLRMDGSAPELGEEAYRAAVRSLSPFFTRLLETETMPWKEEPSDWPAKLAAFDGIWCDGTMQELLIAVARGLVEDKDAVQVTVDPVREDGTVVYHLTVAEDDMGRVIGKQGRIAKAIRVVMRAAAVRQGEKVVVEIG